MRSVEIAQWLKTSVALFMKDVSSVPRKHTQLTTMPSSGLLRHQGTHIVNKYQTCKTLIMHKINYIHI